MELSITNLTVFREMVYSLRQTLRQKAQITKCCPKFDPNIGELLAPYINEKCGLMLVLWLWHKFFG
jgi:hypothetical protein